MNFRSFICLALSIATLSSCNATSVDLYSNGIGTELPYAGIGQQTSAQDAYVSCICQQTGSPRACDWREFVLAGMNDIDNRCDGYLGWLDNRRRSNGPLQNEIADTSETTATILAATGAGGTAIGVVAAAFGLARNSFDNAQSRLLMEVNHSTVQTIVLANQDRFRKDLQGVTVASRPVAIYVLRQYLRLCMPFTIENQINTTITTYQIGGAQALAKAEANPLIELASLNRIPVRPETRITKPVGVIISDNNPFKLVVVNPEKISTKLITRALTGICARPDEIKSPNSLTVARVKVLQQWRKISLKLPNKQIDGKLDQGDLNMFSDERTCRMGTRNFYEAFEYPGGIMTAAGDLIGLLNGRLAEGDKLPASANEDAIRAAIGKVKKQMTDLELNDVALSQQLTLEFVNKL